MSPDRACRDGKNQFSGFTLIELLVVIFIIGILLAATLTIIPKVKKAVYGAQTQAQLSALAGAIQQYYNDFKSYPGPLPNSQLNTAYDASTAPFVMISGAQVSLIGKNGNTASNNMASGASATGMDTTRVTGAENLVLALCGGLEVTSTGSFAYHPEDIFNFDGVTPAPHGPASLNTANPRRWNAYIQLKPGDLSVPNNGVNSGQFTDSASRAAGDSMIPVFVDKYADPLPILYYRTNVGGTAIVGFRKGSTYVDDSGNALQTAGGGMFGGTAVNEVAQYDLVQNLPYVTSKIGTVGSNTYSVHGLAGVGNSNLSDPIDTNQSGTYTPANSGKNGAAYFKDPALNPPYSTGSTVSNTNQGVARQKDGFLLISAGPDRLYGTHDDSIYPGGTP